MILGQTQEFASPEEALKHHGVKGMKWGVRKEEVRGGGPNAHIRISNKTNRATVSGTNMAAVVGTATIFFPALPLMFLSPRYRAENRAAVKQNNKVQGDKKFKKAIANSKKAAQVHNTAAKEINAQLPAFNSDKRWKGMTPDSPKQKAYDAAVEKELLNPAYAKAAIKVYGTESPTGRYKFEIDSAENGTLKFRDTLKEAHEARQKVEHAADDEELVEVRFDILRNETGHILGFRPSEEEQAMAQSAMGEAGAEFLEHYGIKGMRWGHRKADQDGPEGVPAKTNRDAKKDAEEFTKAKLFYGEGAGTRRKLIKAKVEAKSAKDPLYKKAFDHHVEKTDLAKRSEQAVKERKRTDVKKSVKKTGKGVGHILRGNSQYANTAAAVTVAAGGYARAKGYDKKAMDAGKDFVEKYINSH